VVSGRPRGALSLEEKKQTEEEKGTSGGENQTACLQVAQKRGFRCDRMGKVGKGVKSEREKRAQIARKPGRGTASG